jgi:hypothetical protein
MTTYDHTELRAQYEAEAAFNPQAFKNWQSFHSKNGWTKHSFFGPTFHKELQYRRDPSKPPFVMPTMKEQAMERVCEVNDFLAEQKEDFQATKLTPPSAEQCALIDEAARQAKAGELQSGYWRWSFWFASGNEFGGIWRVGDFNPRALNKWRYTPAPAHPHYATYCEWQQLVDAGEVAKGWWIIHQTDGSCLNPKWRVDFEYSICKTRRHPDNVKPALKLIDWADVPLFAMTSMGYIASNTLQWLGVIDQHGGYLCYSKHEFLHLRLSEQTRFTHLPQGTQPPVVEGLVIWYECISNLGYRFLLKKLDDFENGNFVGYRVIGLQSGYTDNPQEAT